ncbi:hypothetical protein PoB_006288400 [Plakobranchus ocellatus]|uniref:Uncharacterized protein n=1 Tax=Plakobranchus ocellatus TaxID=259542 RepID=A0AAV4CWU0_9GAST|nr:hypothetical protein PoB_006288400 [Plakobranchus ocellatus]
MKKSDWVSNFESLMWYPTAVPDGPPLLPYQGTAVQKKRARGTSKAHLLRCEARPFSAGTSEATPTKAPRCWILFHYFLTSLKWIKLEAVPGNGDGLGRMSQRVCLPRSQNLELEFFASNPLEQVHVDLRVFILFVSQSLELGLFASNPQKQLHVDLKVLILLESQNLELGLFASNTLEQVHVDLRVLILLVSQNQELGLFASNPQKQLHVDLKVLIFLESQNLELGLFASNTLEQLHVDLRVLILLVSQNLELELFASRPMLISEF